jgi:hypothetical protein
MNARRRSPSLPLSALKDNEILKFCRTSWGIENRIIGAGQAEEFEQNFAFACIACGLARVKNMGGSPVGPAHVGKGLQKSQRCLRIALRTYIWARAVSSDCVYQ